MTTVDRSQLSRVVAIANGKGGVGKTSLVASVAGLAAAAGYRVLIVDADPQGDISDDLGLRGAGLSDEGEHLANCLITNSPLRVVVPEARPNLDVITGGEYVSDVAGVLFSRHQKGRNSSAVLADSLAPIANNYDLILIDTPPVDVNLQLLALVAARWLLIPTKADTSSIRGLSSIADRVANARNDNPDLDVLGVVLFDVPSAAKRIRAQASNDITEALGGVAPLFDNAVRSSPATAREARSRGLMVHELAEKVDGAEPFWKQLREGGPQSVERLPGTAPALASDYIGLVDSILTRIAHAESDTPETSIA